MGDEANSMAFPSSSLPENPSMRPRSRQRSNALVPSRPVSVPDIPFRSLTSSGHRPSTPHVGQEKQPTLRLRDGNSMDKPLKGILKNTPSTGQKQGVRNVHFDLSEQNGKPAGSSSD